MSPTLGPADPVGLQVVRQGWWQQRVAAQVAQAAQAEAPAALVVAQGEVVVVTMEVTAAGAATWEEEEAGASGVSAGTGRMWTPSSTTSWLIRICFIDPPAHNPSPHPRHPR